jgi:DNA invertase Pin-like site-specific DNA recombinase
MKKAIGLVRVSSGKQAQEGVSLGIQEQRIQDYAIANDFNLTEIIREEGVSGSKENREAIRRVTTLTEAKEIDAVIFYDNSRLARKETTYFTLEGLFRKKGVSLHYTTSGESDIHTADGRLKNGIEAIVSAHFSHKISERTKEALAKLKEDGRRLGCPNKVAYGLILKRSKTPTLSDLKPDPKKVKEIRKAYRLRREGLSIRKVAEAVKWSKKRAEYVLNNPIYRDLGVIRKTVVSP